MLDRVEDGDMYERLLFDVVYCSTRLGLNEETDYAIAELDKLPQPESSRLIVDFIRAMTLIDQENAYDGLDLIEKNLESGVLQQEDWRFWKYQHLAWKGRALTRLARCEEALIALGLAHEMDPNGNRETAILISQANCLSALNRCEEAYDAARQVLGRGDEEMATLAVQYMADCRMWQKRPNEALVLYADLQKRLPCRLVDKKVVKASMKKAKSLIKENRPRKWPF